MIATHIVPLFAPVIDGVGDYAYFLGRALREKHGIESRYVVCDPSWPGASGEGEFEATGPVGFDGERLRRAVGEAEAIILHYVGYAYERRGAPDWLAQALREWKRGDRSLVTVFHEIWSKAPPWKSAFWFASAQKRVAGEIGKLSDAMLTSTAWMTRELEKLCGRRAEAAPIPPPTLADPKDAPRRGDGKVRVLVFGQTWTRVPAVKHHAALLRALDDAGKLEGVCVIGKGCQNGAAASDDVRLLREIVGREKVRALGEAPAEEILSRFAEADLYLSCHEARNACKSGGVAAAFATGCVVALTPSEDVEPLRAGEHFVVCDGSAEGARSVVEQLANGREAISAKARRWHEENGGWGRVASCVAAGLSRKG